jgi:hypothetical protein
MHLLQYEERLHPVQWPVMYFSTAKAAHPSTRFIYGLVVSLPAGPGLGKKVKTAVTALTWWSAKCLWPNHHIEHPVVTANGKDNQPSRPFSSLLVRKIVLRRLPDSAPFQQPGFYRCCKQKAAAKFVLRQAAFSILDDVVPYQPA